MAKLTAWLVTLIGILLVLQAGAWLPAVTAWNGWVIALAVLIIGVNKLMIQLGKRK
jgi:hypothetical protein